MQETYAGRIEIIGVSGRDEPEAMAAFVDTHDVGAFPHIVDLDLEIWMRYGVASQPGFVFIDDDGSTETVIGSMGEAGLSAKLDDLLAT